MPDNVEITINSKEKFTGRLIGIINHDECKAIMNSDESAKKIFSSESISLNDVSTAINKRFVIATTSYSDDGDREVFISPSIRSVEYTSFPKKFRIFKCSDDNEYKIKEL